MFSTIHTKSVNFPNAVKLKRGLYAMSYIGEDQILHPL